jgi:H2-forming N5,N10-methylenetetrahydromethanopterin dehydrogenase-like enzyme
MNTHLEEKRTKDSWKIMQDIFTDIQSERYRQEQLRQSGKFLWTCSDTTRSNEEKLAVLAEEFGEISKEVVEGIIKGGKLATAFNEKTLELAHSLSKELNTKLRKELVQVAAVCVAWIEAIDQEAKKHF